MNSNQKIALVTGSAGFIGYFLSKSLLKSGWKVIGYDAITDYYDIALKKKRHEMLSEHEFFVKVEERLEDLDSLKAIFKNEKPNVVINLAAQAGVRYSIENPRSYVDLNLIGVFNILECARYYGCDHLLMASTSSVYGANTNMPFNETDKADTQLSFYAATKKANESMAHSYAHLFKIPTTMFRFFTVYGPWGRPDMALFKFTKSILNNTPIDVYNNGEMTRDFTYVEDLVEAIRLLISVPPSNPIIGAEVNDSLSPVAPWRVVNIGNSKSVSLLDYIKEIENVTGIKAVKNLMTMQPGDVVSTLANTELLKELTGYQPQTDVATGIREFVRWYISYYNK